MELATVRKNNNFVAPKKENRKEINFKIVVYFYRILRVVCFLDFGFCDYKSTKQKIVCKSITVFQLVIFCVVCLLIMDYQHCLHFFTTYTTSPSKILYYRIYYPAILVFYCINVLLLLSIAPNKTFYKLLKDLKAIDDMLQADVSRYHLEIVLLAMNGSHIIFKVLFHLFFNSLWCIPLYLFNMVVLIVQLTLIAHAFAMYSIKCRLNELTSIIKADGSRNIPYLQIVYKDIVDLLEGFKTAFDPIIAASLLFCIPQLMAHIYLSLESYFEEQNFTKYLSSSVGLYIVITERTLMLFLPAIFASMLGNQVDKIKITLHNKLMQVRDEAVQQDIRTFIEYVEVRNCRLCLYKVMPLNAELPIMALKFCVTYLIVMVQFTHK